MSEQEMKNVNEMDAAEMLEQHQGRECADRQGQTTEDWAWKVIRELEAEEKRRHHRQGWEAFGLCVLSGLTVAACCAAVLYGCWKPIVMGIAAANLMMAGAWWQAAKAGWQACA